MASTTPQSLGNIQIHSTSSSATGDVVGPASSTDNAIVRFDSTTGKLIQNSVVTIADTTGAIAGTNAITVGTASTTAGTVTLLNATNANTLILKAGVTSGSYTLTLPTAVASAGQVLTDAAGDGIMSWTTAATASNTITFTNKRITSRVGTETTSATSTPTADSVDQWNITALAEADAIAAPTGTPTDGQSLLIRIKDNGTARALTWNAIYRASSDLSLPSTTVLSKTMYCEFIYNAADSKWDFVGFLNNF